MVLFLAVKRRDGARHARLDFTETKRVLKISVPFFIANVAVSLGSSDRRRRCSARSSARPPKARSAWYGSARQIAQLSALLSPILSGVLIPDDEPCEGARRTGVLPHPPPRVRGRDGGVDPADADVGARLRTSSSACFLKPKRSCRPLLSLTVARADVRARLRERAAVALVDDPRSLLDHHDHLDHRARAACRSFIIDRGAAHARPRPRWRPAMGAAMAMTARELVIAIVFLDLPSEGHRPRSSALAATPSGMSLVACGARHHASTSSSKNASARSRLVARRARSTASSCSVLRIIRPSRRHRPSSRW